MKTGPTAPGEAAGEHDRLDGPLRGARPHPALDHHVEEHSANGPQKLDTVVFGVTAVIAIGFVLWGFLNTESLGTASANSLSWVVTNMGWLFALVASGFVVFVIWLAASKYGRIPLGRDDEEPEFRTVSWIAMMFSAGMGIGLMFYGVSEPLSHFVTPPPGTGAAGNPEAVQTAMATTLFHWTLHPWAIYAVVGLAVAYGVFRKGRSLLISSAFAPLLGEKRANGPAGKVIDILAIFATLFGSAASLGLGALQIGSGLEIVGGIGTVGNGVLVAIITILTVCFILSAVSGVAKGIQWLSNINMVLAVVLAFFVFVVGPTVFILDLVPTAIGSYFQDLAMMSARTDASGGDAMQEWLSGWTIFYWAWWVSWTPFVGMFIARISRGRTIRQFVTGVLFVPSVVSLVWFAIFGGAGIQQQRSGIDIAGEGSAEGSLFAMLGNLPLSTVTSIVVMLLVAIFFVSGADAASIVMGTLSERGTLVPSRPTVIFWGAATGAVAAVMLLVGGDDALTGLQNITIVAALPFLLVMIGLAIALVKDLSKDPLIVRRAYAVAAVEQAVVSGVTDHGDDFTLVYEEAKPGEGVGELVAIPTSAAASESEDVLVDGADRSHTDVRTGSDAGRDAGTNTGRDAGTDADHGGRVPTS
ncbi:choline/carnitine/betaine transport [Knoellia remsis]|uniref:Choline/carnitine/betaine transport n=1 Tax=Knoellia remsis TaxID=407159 RepID=A0A2T0V0V5_9MICO|nr:BCCT family transporter [Knoellia remsis]PRY63708.1 choline/carnitine/betaine transport [Knoellia remsis]